MLIFVKKSTVSYRKWEYGRCLYMTRGRQYGPASVMCGDGEMLPTAVYLAVQGAAHLVEHDVLCVEGTHEAEGDGLAVGGVGGLHVGIVVEGEATALIEADAAAGELVGGGLGLEDEGLLCPGDEHRQGFAAIATAAHLGREGEVLDVGEAVEGPGGEEAYWFCV